MARSARYRFPWRTGLRGAVVTLVSLTAASILSSCDLALYFDDTAGSTEVLDPGPSDLQILQRPIEANEARKVGVSQTRWTWLNSGQTRNSVQMELLSKLAKEGTLSGIVTSVSPCEPYTALVLGGGVLGFSLMTFFSGNLPPSEPLPVQEAYLAAGAVAGSAVWVFLPSCDVVSVEAMVGPQLPDPKAE